MVINKRKKFYNDLEIRIEIRIKIKYLDYYINKIKTINNFKIFERKPIFVQYILKIFEININFK